MPISIQKKSQALINWLAPRVDQLSFADSRRLTDAYLSLSNFYISQGRLDLALVTIEDALGLLPESTELIDSLAGIHARYAALYKEVARRQRASQKKP
ncbi:MAG: hypothetical protein ACO326_07110 [Burkholderiaceae bacterium]|jgi:hypothetical protein